MRFSGKVAIVTGGGQGIGRAIALAFADKGASVVLAELDPEAGTEIERYINERGGRCLFIETDVSDEDSVRHMVKLTVDKVGKPTILCNNAGINVSSSIDTMDMALWDKVLSVNLKGPYMCVKYVAPEMKYSGGGSIVNIASTRALMSEPNTEPYSASKGGILALTHALAVSLGKDNIRVNAISPGWIEVSDWKKGSLRLKPDLTEMDHIQHPVGRVGRPEDIASACLFLTSDESGFITGTNLIVDGGMTIKMIYQ